MTGLDVRMTNIPADAGTGFGVFDTLHDVAEPGLLADRLRDASARFYGTAGRAFLARLVETRGDDPDGFYERVKASRMQFISDHLPVGSDGQVRSVCGRFGVIAAAGELATEWNILPWEAGETTQAAVTCFQAWLGERGGTGAGEVHAALRQVRQFFEAHGTSRFAEIRQYSTRLDPGPRCRPVARHLDGDMDIFPASPTLVALPGAVVGDAMADAVDAAELLDVDMDEFAWLVALVADHRGAGRQRRKPAQPMNARTTGWRGALRWLV